MKKLLYYAGAGIIYLSSLTASAQYPDTSVVNHYPPKISILVYNILRAVNIDADRQQVLAGLYVTEDSLVAKARPEQMDSIRSQTWAGLQDVLTPDELNQYISYYREYTANADTNTTAAFQARYFNNRIAQLDSVKPLSKKVKAKLAHNADSICKLQQGLTLERVFINAFYTASLRDTTYVGFLMGGYINITAYASARYYTYWYTQNYHISAACKTRLYPLYLEKERQLTLMRYTGATSQEAWQKKYTKITTLYDSLVYRLMVFDGKASPDSTLYYTLYYKDFIKLSAGQVSSVYETAIQLYHLQLKQTQKNPTKPYDKWKFVRTKLKTILDDDQYDKMLLMKNMDKANKNAVITWKNMKADSLTQWLDSVKTTTEIKTYLLRRYMTGDTFDDDKPAQKTHLKALEALAPYHMKRFHARRKKEAMAQGDPFRGSFTW